MITIIHHRGFKTLYESSDLCTHGNPFMSMALEVFVHVMESFVSVDIRFEVVPAFLASVLQFRHFSVGLHGHIVRIVGTEKMVI